MSISVCVVQDGGNGGALVLNNKQGFQDSEVYAKLEEWLGVKADEYWDKNFDILDVVFFFSELCSSIPEFLVVVLVHINF